MQFSTTHVELPEGDGGLPGPLFLLGRPLHDLGVHVAVVGHGRRGAVVVVGGGRGLGHGQRKLRVRR